MNLNKRLRIAFDVSENYRRQLKSISYRNGMTMKKLALLAIAEKYPELRPQTDWELAHDDE